MKGISRRTTKLGFNVLRLHYTADPDKDPTTETGKRWYDEARKGMSEARWSAEYDIDYGALSGTLVFPEFEAGTHVVPAFELNPHDWTIWMACDPHPRTPHAFVWLGVNREGEMVVPFAWWPEHSASDDSRFTVADYAEKVKKVEEYFAFQRPYRLMDVAGRSMNATEELSYFDAYRDAGLQFQAAKKNRDMSGFERINEALKLKPYGPGDREQMRPSLTVMEGNDELVYQIRHLRFAEWRGNVIDKDDPQMPVEKRRHLVDALCYILLDKPRFLDRGRVSNSDGARNVIRATK